jgi:hypothetical protein
MVDIFRKKDLTDEELAEAIGAGGFSESGQPALTPEDFATMSEAKETKIDEANDVVEADNAYDQEKLPLSEKQIQDQIAMMQQAPQIAPRAEEGGLTDQMVKDQQQRDIASTDSGEEKSLTEFQQLMKKYDESQADYKKRMQESQGQRDQNRRMASFFNAMENINRGLASQGGYYKLDKARTHDYYDPTKDVKKDMSLQELMAKYKILGGGKETEKMTPYQRKKLEHSKEMEDRRVSEQKRKVEKEEREREVPGVGIAPTKKDAEELKKDKASTEEAIKILEKVKELGTDVNVLTDRTRVNKINSLLNQAVGKMRISMTGGGPLTEEERAMIRESLGDPSKLFSTESIQKAVLDQNIEQLKQSLKDKYSARGVEVAENKPKSVEQLAPNEIKRQTKDGRVAIFDKESKKFLRYE